MLPECAARRWGGREALYFRGRRQTFAQLAAGVDRVARGLIALGVRPGDKVALWLLNRPEWIEIAFAVMKIGAVLVPINTRLRTEDVAYIVDQSDSSTLILAEPGHQDAQQDRRHDMTITRAGPRARRVGRNVHIPLDVHTL